MLHRRKRQPGFTLAELLVALTIMGVIATFTIPKVLVAQQTYQYKAIAKEAIGMVAGSYQQYMFTSVVDQNTGISSITPSMNYVNFLTSGNIDDEFGQGTASCSSSTPCLKLHNGAVLRYRVSSGGFGGTATTNGVWFKVDPDGVVTDGTTNGPGKALCLFLYTNGRVADIGSIPDTTNQYSTYTANTNSVPPWFSW